MERQKTILLVEDEALIALLETSRLETEGYKVIHASSGEKAVEAVGNGTPIDLILMDINLGEGMDGTEAAAIILEDHDLPLLFLSSHTEKELVEKTERITNYGYVVKNSSFTVLDASIKMALKLFASEATLKKANAELALSESKFSNAFNAQPDPVIISRLRDGVCIDVNQGFTTVFGYAQEDIKGKDLMAPDLGLWVHPEERERLAEVFSTTGKATNVEIELKAKSGEIQVLLLSARPLEIDGERCAISVLKVITAQKRLEQSILESETRFQTAFMSAPIGISLMEFDGSLTSVNQAYCRMLGYTMQEINEKTLMDITHPDDLPLTLSHIRNLISGKDETARFQKRSIHKDGHTVWVDVSMSRMRDAHGELKRFIVHTIDITEQKKQDLALRDSESALRKAQAVAHLGSWRWEIPTNHLEWSDEMYRIFGIDKATFSGFLPDVIQRAIHPEDRAAVEAANLSVATEGKAVPLEYRIVSPDGQTRTVWAEAGELQKDALGNPSVLSGIVLDITDRVRSRTDLERSIERLQFLTDTIADVIWVFNPTKNAFTYISPSVEKLRGFTVEEALAQDLYASLTKESAEMLEKVIPLRYQKFLKEPERKVYYTDQLQQPCKDGSVIWIETSTYFRFNDSKDLEVIGVSRDISDRKKYEDMLKERDVRSKAMLKAIPDLMFRLNRSGIILDYKGEMSDLYVQSPPGLIGLDIHEVMPQEFLLTVDSHIKEVLKTGKLRTFEYDLPIPQKGLRHYEARMAKSGEDEVTAIIRDFTEQSAMEKELRDDRETIRGYFTMGTIGMCITSPTKGWVEINDYLCRLLGYSREELKEMTWAELTHPEDLTLDVALFEAVMRGERESYQLDKRFIRKGGEVLDTSMYVTCQRHEDGSVKHFFSSIVDITERKKAEASLQKAIEDKNLLMKELQHRVKNSFTSIMGLLHLELRGNRDAKTLHLLESMGTRLNTMSTLYALLSHQDRIARVSAKAYLSALISDLGKAYIGSRDRVTIAENITDIELDSSEAVSLGLIVNELVTNAMKHAFPDSRSGSIEVGLSSEEGTLSLTVKDDGVGDQERKSGTSTGFGMRLVEMLTQQLGGELVIERSNGWIVTIKGFPAT